MKQLYLFLTLSLLSMGLFAQDEANSLPPSFRIAGFNAQADVQQFNAPDLSQLSYLDEMDRTNGHPYRMAMAVPAGLAMQLPGN